MNQIRFNSSMLRSSVCDYSDVYIPAKGTITVENKAVQGPPNNPPIKK